MRSEFARTTIDQRIQHIIGLVDGGELDAVEGCATPIISDGSGFTRGTIHRI